MRSCLRTQAGPVPHASTRHAVVSLVLLVLLVGGLFGPAHAVPSRTPSDLPLDHWGYPILERLRARGVLDIDLTTRPVARSAVRAALEEAGVRPELTSRELWMIERLRAEFIGGEVDAPTVGVSDGRASLGFGVELSILTRAAHGGDPCEVVGWLPNDFGSTGPLSTSSRGTPLAPSDDDGMSMEVLASYDLWGGFGDVVGFYSDVDILLHGQEGERVERVSGRARTWRGITAEAEHAYVKIERPHLSIAIGRRGPAWGRSNYGRLLISGNAPTFDQLDASFRLGHFSFHTLHALVEYTKTWTEEDLGDDDNIMIAGHRMVVARDRLTVGLGELVVYSSVTPDPVYLNPLVPYYLAQHNQREDDNIFWLLDFDWLAAIGHEFYGEFLVDDLQYERYTESPDKYGVTLGYTFYGAPAGRFDVELTAEYSQVRKWAYTHNRIEHRLEHDGVPVGFELGPDSDKLTLMATVHPSPAWSIEAGYVSRRSGEGSLDAPFVKGVDNPDTRFPSGDVERVDEVSLGVAYDGLDGGTRGNLELKWYNAFGCATDGWEIRAGIGFRI